MKMNIKIKFKLNKSRTDLMSNFKTSFIYVGIFVKNKYVPQFDVVCPIINAIQALDVIISFHGVFNLKNTKKLLNNYKCKKILLRF